MTSPLQKQDVDHRLPIYQRLRDLFVQKIQLGEWENSRAIPAELELATQYGVAPGTIRRAIESLVTEGYLIRKQGSGTFVRQANFGNALFRFFRHTDEHGQVILPVAKILSRRLAAATSTEREKLVLSMHHSGLGETKTPDSVITAPQVIRLKRIRKAADQPLLYEEISVCAQRFRALVDADADAFEDLLYPMYDRLCKVKVHNASETISFGLAKPEVAKHLETITGEPVAVIERLAFGIDGSPVEWRTSYGLASRFSYSIELK